MKPSNERAFGWDVIAPLKAIEDIGETMSDGDWPDVTRHLITVGTSVMALARDASAALSPLEKHPQAREHIAQARSILQGLDAIGDDIIERQLGGDDSEDALKKVGGALEGLVCATVFHINSAARAAGYTDHIEIRWGIPVNSAA